MFSDMEYKCVAPDIDCLLNRFERGFLNPSAPTKELLSSLDPLFDAVKDLKPHEKTMKQSQSGLPYREAA